jgi:glutathione S-transferase
MVEGFRRLDGEADGMASDPPDLATIAAVVALDYVRFRFPDAGWMPEVGGLDRLRERVRGRPSIERTVPYV